MSNAFNKQDFLVTAVLSSLGKKVNLKELTDESLIKVALVLLVRDTPLFYSLLEDAKLVGSGSIVCPVRNGQQVVITSDQFDQVRKAYIGNNFGGRNGPQLIEAIKTLRSITNLGLAEAKDAIEYMVSKNILRQTTLADLLAEQTGRTP